MWTSSSAASSCTSFVSHAILRAVKTKNRKGSQFVDRLRLHLDWNTFGPLGYVSSDFITVTVRLIGKTVCPKVQRFYEVSIDSADKWKMLIAIAFIFPMVVTR